MATKLDSIDPDDVKDYGVNWATHLDGDTISTSSWAVESGTATIDSSGNTSTATTVWLSGATPVGSTLQVRNRITTAGGRTLDWTLHILVDAR